MIRTPVPASVPALKSALDAVHWLTAQADESGARLAPR